jgi:predicted RND superfamily exporter protein
MGTIRRGGKMSKKLLGWIFFLVPLIIIAAVFVYSLGWYFIPVFIIACILAASITYGVKLIQGW